MQSISGTRDTSSTVGLSVEVSATPVDASARTPGNS